jgi:hypothetical protein
MEATDGSFTPGFCAQALRAWVAVAVALMAALALARMVFLFTVAIGPDVVDTWDAVRPPRDGACALIFLRGL